MLRFTLGFLAGLAVYVMGERTNRWLDAYQEPKILPYIGPKMMVAEGGILRGKNWGLND